MIVCFCVQHNKEGERVFTGVAFVDFFDEQSMRKALSLHQSKLWPGSLKINIRRTLDKSRLAAVAASRTNQVQSKKQVRACARVCASHRNIDFTSLT